MRPRSVGRPLTLLVTVIGVVLLAHHGLAQEGGRRGSPPIVIGYVGGLSGPTAAFGKPALEGVEFAVEEINRQGGIMGRRVELVSVDDQGDPFRAQQAIDRLVSQGVRWIISGSSSAGALAQVPRVRYHKVVAITPLGSDPRITASNQGDPWFFANIPNNTMLGGAIARFAARKLFLREVAVFVRDDAYGQSITDGFAMIGLVDGLKLVTKVTYPVTAQDFRSDLAKVLARRPDAIFLSGYAADAGLIAKQARMLGFTGTLLGTNPLTSPQYREIAGDASENTYVSSATNADPRRRTDAESSFVEKWQLAKGQAPNAYQSGAYDAVYLFKRAIEAVGTDPGAVRGFLLELRDYSGASGTFSFKPDGSVAKPVYIVRLVGGRWEFQETVLGL